MVCVHFVSSATIESDPQLDSLDVLTFMYKHEGFISPSKMHVVKLKSLLNHAY